VRGAPVARRLRAALLAVIAALYVVSIPWYRDSGAEASVWLGLPDWVAVALLCYLAVAVLNSFAWLLTDVPDRDERDESERR
jgi:hypothetical protein